MAKHHSKLKKKKDMEEQEQKHQEQIYQEPEQQKQKEPETVLLEEEEEEEGAFSDATTLESSSTSEEEQEKRTGAKFVSRVTSLPIVQDGVSTVQAMANKTSLGRFALSKANSTLSTVSKYQPRYVQSYYQSYIQPHIERADELGCRSLDLIQTKFPVVNQPTSELVRSVTGPSYQIVDGVKVRIDSSIKQPATHVAQEANKRLGSVVDNVEAVIDRYLPKIQETKREQEAQEVNQAVRAYYLFNDATFRFSQTVSEQVKATAAQLPRSRDDLARIASGQNLLDKATANIQNLQNTLAESVKLCTQSAQSHLPPSVNQRLQDLQATSQERLQLLTQQVSIQLSQVTEFLKVQSSPEWLKSRVTSLVDVANKQVELVRSQYTRNDISALEKAKNVAQGLQQQVLPILQTVQAQLTYYSEAARQKASQDLRAPFEYLGLNHAPKVATA